MDSPLRGKDGRRGRRRPPPFILNRPPYPFILNIVEG